MSQQLEDFDNALFAYQKATITYNGAVAALNALDASSVSTSDGLLAITNAITAVQLAQVDVQQTRAAISPAIEGILDAGQTPDSVIAMAAAQGITLTNQQVTGQTPPVCTSDNFQGFRFYDGSSFGYVRLFADHVELLVDKPYSVSLDGTVPHTFRVTGKGKDLKFYIDGQLSIDASGQFKRQTSARVVEFGDVAGRSQHVSSSWDSIKYSTSGAFPPSSAVDYVLEEVASFPGTSIGTLQEYSDSLYVSVDPADQSLSSKIYRFKKGADAQVRSVIAVTKSNVTSVVVDPNRDGNLFGTTGKYIGTQSGLQYILGSKPAPLDIATGMDADPTTQGWRLEQNCTADRHSLSGGAMTIDTTTETGDRFWKYTMRAPQDTWVTEASNATGWTVEVRVKVAADGTGGNIDGRSYGLLSDNQNCLPQDSRTVDTSEPPPDTLNAPGVLIDDGTYEEFVQFFEKGIGLKYAGLFAPQTMTDQFYTVRIIGKNKSIAVYTKGDSDRSFHRIILAPDGLSVKTQPLGDQELPSIVVDDTGFSHAVWQDSRNGAFAIFHAQTGPSHVLGKGTISSPGLFPNPSMLFARTVFGLPATGAVDTAHQDPRALVSGQAAFVSWGVVPGDFLLVYDQEDSSGNQLSSGPKKYTVLSVASEAVVILDTDENLSSSFAFASFVVMRGNDKWLPPTIVSTEAFESTRPCLMKHSSGELYVAYQNDSTGEPQVYVRRGAFDPFATTWLDTVMVTNGSGGAAGPQVAEAPNGDLLVVWEDSGTKISGAIVSIAAFGASQTIRPTIMTPASSHARNPRLAVNGSRAIVAYEDDAGNDGNFDVYAVEADAVALTDGTVVKQTSSGMAANPSVCAFQGTVVMAYEDAVSGSSQIWASIGSYATGTLAWGALTRVTNSRGSAKFPDVSCDGSGNAFVAFQDDRTRNGYQDLYVARYDGGTHSWLSSGQDGLDVKIENYVTYSRKPRISRDSKNNLAIAFETTKDGGRNRIAYTVYDGALVTIDDTVSAYFPLDDDAADTVVHNKIRAYRGSSVPPLEIVLAIDTSSAMSQNSNLDSCKQGASFIVSQLDETALFNVQSFADIQQSTVQSLSASLLPGTSDNQSSAQDFITNVGISNAGIGQPPGGAIGALNSNFGGSDKLKVVVLFSAGSPSATAEQVSAFRKLVKGLNANNVHIFAFSAGPSNSSMLSGLTADNGGQFFQASDAVDLSTQVSDFFQLITSSDFAAQIFDFSADGPTNGTASAATSAFHVSSPDPGIAMQDPALQAAFDLRSPGRVFSVPADLFHQTGAVDVWVKPAYASTDATTRAFFGNVSPTDSSVKDSISCGLVGGTLKLRIVDTNGALHETAVAPSGFSWAASDLVHLRAVWDGNSIGVSTINQISFASTTVGYACANTGAVFKTTNGGDAWSLLRTGVTYEMYSIDFPVDASTGYACGELGTVLKTTDGGGTWAAIDTGETADLNAIFFKDNSVGYAAGSSGTILRTKDGGATWVNVSPASALSDFKDVGVLYDGSTTAIVAVGADAQVYRWVDDGSDNVAFSAASTPATRNLNGMSRVHQAGAFPAFIVGDANTIMKSTNAGATWTALTIKFPFKFQPQLRAVSADPTGTLVYAVGQNGTFAYSKDGGATWSTCTTGLKNGAWKAIDANFHGLGGLYKIVAAGSSGSVMISDDGGAIQRYTVTRSGNLTIQIDGKEPDQSRVGDQPFTWDPTARDVFFGDFNAAGTAPANAVFDELIVYLRPPPTLGAMYRRKEMWTFQSDAPLLIQRPEMEKRIEFGSISPSVKTKSFWQSVNAYVCGAKEPLQQFAWTAQMGEVDDIVRGMSLDSAGRLWLATENGICNFDTSSASDDIEDWLNGVPLIAGPRGRFVNYTNLAAGLAKDSVSCITVDSNDNVWAGCNSGVMMLSQQQASFSEANATADPVNTVGKPGLGALGGGEVLNAPQVQFSLFSIVQGLPSNNILCIKAFGSSVFVGTDNGLAIISPTGVDPFNTTTTPPSMGAAGATSGSSVTNPGSLATNQSFTSGQDSNSASSQPTTAQTYDILVFSMATGLPSNRIQALGQESKSGEYWVGTNHGISRLKPATAFNYDISNGLVDDDVFSITMDEEDRKYVGTGAGITVIDGTDFDSFLPSDGIGTGAVVAGDEDSTGHFWFATSGGLVEFQKDCGQAFIPYTQQDGIIGNPQIVDYQRYVILGGRIPVGGCNKALVSVSVNGVQLSGGYTVDPFVPWIIFDQPLKASDRVEALVQKSWRQVHDFDQDPKNTDALAAIHTDAAKFFVYKKRFPAGQVVLGGNHATGQANSADSMYAILAIPNPGVTGPVIGAISSPLAAVSGTGAHVGASTSFYIDISDPVTLLPSELVGAEFIQFPSADFGDIAEDYLDFTLNGGSTIYVAFDARATALPNWLRGFTPVKATYRVTDMEAFTDASNIEKLFVTVSGTNGCLYDILQDSTICDISGTIPLDATGPDGCAKITRVNSLTNITLSLTATDLVTGVADMQVSPRSDFTLDGTTAVPFVPFVPNYNLEIPVESSTSVNSILTIDPALGTANLFFNFNGAILVGTSNPGAVYAFNAASNELTLLFDTGEQEVVSMAVFGSLLIVGTGVNGKAFSWNGTTLHELSVPGGERITALIAYNNLLFLGCSPNGDIFQMDIANNVTLFKHTFETGITGFAIFGGQLFWTSFNDVVAAGEVLSTVTRQGHRHTMVVPSGATKLSDISGQTSVVDGHSHAVVAGMLQPASTASIPLHTHALNGSASGKAFAYDSPTGQAVIRHSDVDYDMTAIASTSNGTGGLMFAGTFPNGKILRYVHQENIFIKSFDTASDLISDLRSINGSMYALADNNLFLFDGVRWQFVAAAQATIKDVIAAPQGVYILMPGSIGISTGKPPTTDPNALKDQSICAWVRFRDTAGNVTSIVGPDGKVIACYNPCVQLKDVLGGGTGSGTGSGGTSSSGTNLTQVHRLLEIDSDTNVVFSANGVEPFIAGNKVEQEVGVYLSEVFNGTNSLVQWVSISWDAVTPPGTAITIAVRSAPTAADVATAPWGDEFTDKAGNDLTNQVGQFLQFRATLTVSVAGAPSPELDRVNIQLRTSQATHYYTTNFSLPDKFLKGLLVYNGCVNPPVTDVVFGVTGLNSTDFGDYLVISPGKLFNLPDQHQTQNLRVGIKLISSPTSVPIVDEFALLMELANDAIVRLNLPGAPGSTSGPFVPTGPTRTVTTDQVQGHAHTVTFASTITDKHGVNGQTSVNAGHSHLIVNGVVQIAAGHTHEFFVD